MIYTPLTKKALKLCFDSHKNQTDKTGMPYVFHPFHLAEQMDDELSTVCALLHDVVEDTDLSFDDLLKMGFPTEVTDVLRLLTHEDGVPYMDYVKNISVCPTATKVKIADLGHNLDLSRMDESQIDAHTLARAEKYKRALELLTSDTVE